jgi:glucose/mannose-6-phosphate isomerase
MEMKNTILDFPKQFKVGLEKAKDIRVEGKFENIVICGMGGSALPANLLITYLSDLKLPLYIHRSYNLPLQARQQSLIICISYSGNTEETISAFEEAKKRNLKTIVITTGGKLKELAETYNTPLVLLPSGIQPRSATGYLFSALVKVLSNSGVVKDRSREILETAENLNSAELEDKGKNLAKKLVGKIPLIYASDNFKALARIWKIKFNENSKIMAFWNYFPELNHNEMESFSIFNFQFSIFKNFHILILQDKDDQSQILKRMQLTADLLKEKEAEVDFVEIEGKNILEKIFNNLLLSDWVSYYLAKEYQVNPEKVELIEEFKRKMKE